MGSWKDYLASRTRRFTFADMGMPDWWADIRSADTMPFGEAMALASSGNENDTEQTANLLKRYIVNWNIPDPEDENKILPLPSIDVKSLDCLPSEMIVILSEWILQGAKIATLVPQQSET